MQLPVTDRETMSLGEFLRETRTQLTLDLEAVAEETKISPKNLRAIEEGNFTALPAEVFTRGFYILYAKCLSLDPEEVLAMYEKEKQNLPKDSRYKTPPPYRLAQNMKNLADPPSSLPFAYFGFILLLLLFFGAFLCWYFSWNPASYLSFKLRSLDAGQQVEQPVTQPKIAKTILASTPIANTTAVPPTILDLSGPTTATAATDKPLEQKEPRNLSETTKYHVSAIFQDETKISLTIDDTPRRTMVFKNGEQVSWRAVEKLIVTLPPATNTKISLNGILLNLPAPVNDCITLAIPEDLLR